MAEDTGDPAEEDAPVPEGPAGRREVEVPMALYKRVTVFGTMLAVVAVLFGFVLLDAATLRGSGLRWLVVQGFSAFGLTVPSPVLSAVFAIAGMLTISLGAGVYILSTRFRTEGMGKSKDRADEESDNG